MNAYKLNNKIQVLFANVRKGAANSLHRGSYTNAHVLLNLLHKLGKKINCEALLSILSISPNEFNQFSNTGAGMEVSIYHMTLQSHLIHNFCTKMFRFCHFMDHNTTHNCI